MRCKKSELGNNIKRPTRKLNLENVFFMLLEAENFSHVIIDYNEAHGKDCYQPFVDKDKTTSSISKSRHFIVLAFLVFGESFASLQFSPCLVFSVSSVKKETSN